jgi:hypothetical protein
MAAAKKTAFKHCYWFALTNEGETHSLVHCHMKEGIGHRRVETGCASLLILYFSSSVSKFCNIRPILTMFLTQGRQNRGGRANTSRGGRGGRGGNWYPKPFPQVRSGPYGSKIDSIDIKDVLIEEKAPKISNVEYVASYNWVDAPQPTILVPGKLLRIYDRILTSPKSNPDISQQVHHQPGLHRQWIYN